MAADAATTCHHRLSTARRMKIPGGDGVRRTSSPRRAEQGTPGQGALERKTRTAAERSC